MRRMPPARKVRPEGVASEEDASLPACQSAISHAANTSSEPSEGVCVVPDMLRGDVEIPWDRMDMQVLMNSPPCCLAKQ